MACRPTSNVGLSSLSAFVLRIRYDRTDVEHNNAVVKNFPVDRSEILRGRRTATPRTASQTRRRTDAAATLMPRGDWPKGSRGPPPRSPKQRSRFRTSGKLIAEARKVFARTGNLRAARRQPNSIGGITLRGCNHCGAWNLSPPDTKRAGLPAIRSMTDRKLGYIARTSSPRARASSSRRRKMRLGSVMGWTVSSRAAGSMATSKKSGRNLPAFPGLPPARTAAEPPPLRRERCRSRRDRPPPRPQ